MPDSSLALTKQLIWEGVPQRHNAPCSKKVIAVISLLICLSVALLLSPELGIINWGRERLTHPISMTWARSTQRGLGHARIWWRSSSAPILQSPSHIDALSSSAIQVAAQAAQNDPGRLDSQSIRPVKIWQFMKLARAKQYMPATRTSNWKFKRQASAAASDGASAEAGEDSMSKRAVVLQRLNKVSNIASILCAIDCTVFPLLLTILPLVSVVSTGGATAWLHQVSHACALWFVGPVGGMAVVGNWIQHKRALVGLWGFAGIALIMLANIHLPQVIIGMHVPQAIAHFIHAHHSVINVLGCILLLSSQRYAHTLTTSCCDGKHASVQSKTCCD